MIHRLVALLTLAAVSVPADRALAQGTFPAPLPSQTDSNPRATIGAAPVWPLPSGGNAGSDACMKGFYPLREDAEQKGKMIRAASERHAPPDAACKLIAAFSQAEIKMIKYVEVKAAQCGIPAQIAEQLKAGHKTTEALEIKVCQAAQQRGPAGPSLRRCRPGEYFSDTCVFEMAK
jgi:hypothetical protein